MFRRICGIVVLLGLLLCSIGVEAAFAQRKTVNVRGYTRKDGTYVRPHTRSAPGSQGAVSALPVTIPRDWLLSPTGEFIMENRASLRSGTSINSDVLAVVPPGGAITVDKCEAGWCSVRYQEREGFISQALIPISTKVQVDTNDWIDTACVVRAVVDGETFTCRNGDRVRLLLISPPGPEMGQIIATDAKWALADLAPVGSMVRLELDVEKRDGQGGVLAYVYAADGRMVNEGLALAGYADEAIVEPNVKHADLIRAAIAEAKGQKRGMWGVPPSGCSAVDRWKKKCE